MSDFFLHSFNTLSHGLIGYIIPFLFVLTIVVFFHELGHFLVARWAGVKVLTFSLGFGPELAGFNDRHGTRWKISAIPLGGYVKFFGDDIGSLDAASSETLDSMSAEERAGSFHHKKVGPRAAIVAAGPIANFILAIVIFTCLFTFFGKPSTTARVDKIEANSAAAKAGFQVGDIVTAIDGKTIGSFSDMQRIVGVRCRGYPELHHQARRFHAAAERHAGTSRSEGFVRKRPSSGRARHYPRDAPGDVVTERVDPATALWLGVKETWFVVDRTLAYIGGVFTGREAADQVGGPLRIAQISGQVATIGLPP